MAEVTQQDLYLSHHVINYLYSGLQGSYASANVLIQLEYPGFPKDTLESINQLFTKIAKWLGDLYEGEPLIQVSWQTVETFDANAAFDLLERLRTELTLTTTELKRLSAGMKTEEEVDAAKYFLAAFARYAYSRNSFLEGKVEFGRAIEVFEMAEHYAPALEQSAQDIQVVNSLFDAFRESRIQERAFYEELQFHAKGLPTIFSIQAHEMAVLLATFDKAFTFTHTGISKLEAERWTAAAVPATHAGYWRAYDIGPEEAQAWISGGVDDPQVANDWKNEGFSPSDTLSWLEQEFSPPVARAWQDAHFSPDEATAFIAEGITDPEEARRQR